MALGKTLFAADLAPDLFMTFRNILEGLSELIFFFFNFLKSHKKRVGVPGKKKRDLGKACETMSNEHNPGLSRAFILFIYF